MSNNDKELGAQDGPHRDHAGTGTGQHAGHEPDHPFAQQGPDQGGHGGHKWMGGHGHGGGGGK